MTVELEAMESRSQELLSTAGTILPGACLSQNSLPPELSFVVDHGEGARLVDVRGRTYLDYVLGSGPLLLGHAPGGGPGGPGAGGARLHVPLAFRAIHSSRGDGGRRRALRGAGALRLHRNRGDHVRLPHGARRHPAREDPEVRRRLARLPRLRHGRELARAVRGALPLPRPGHRRHPARSPRKRPRGPLQRSRDDRAHRDGAGLGARGHHRRAAQHSHPPAAGIPRRASRSGPSPRRAPDLRRGRDRLPPRQAAPRSTTASSPTSPSTERR